MPYILGTVSEATGRNTSSPCMSFQVKCLNKPHINPVIAHVPPSFFVSVAQDEYILEITNSSGLSKTVVASALTPVGGGVVLNVAVG
jgi:hypothetical protein